MQMDGAEERRAFRRVEHQFNVRLVARISGDRTSISELPDSRSINISGSGLLVNTNENLEPGTMLSVVFMKPRTFEMFKGSGRIVRVEKAADGTYNLGISFSELQPEEQQKLDECLTRI